MNYQAVIRNSSGQPLVSQPVNIRVTLQDSNGKSAHYSEQHAATTAPNGVVNLIIGTGTPLHGTFANIPWSQGDIHLKIEVALSGSKSYTLLGITQLQSVPYALFAADGNQGEQGEPGVGIQYDWNDTELGIKREDDTEFVYVNIKGETGPQGIQGDKGIQGEQGLQGIQGEPGLQGEQGEQGVAGKDGRTVLYDTTNPAKVVGMDGDFYINTTTNHIFGPKSGGTWSAGVSLIGPAGPQGIQGEQGPQGIQGEEGTEGPLVAGTQGQSLVHDGTSWVASSNIFTDAIENVGIGIAIPTEKLDVDGNIRARGKLMGETIEIDQPETQEEEPIFVVRNKAGQIVFAVYETGVRIYVDDSVEGGKGNKSGFAIGGFTGQKEGEDGREFLRVTPDSVRVNTRFLPDKGNKGGFAIGGFTGQKEIPSEVMYVSPEYTRINVETTGIKGNKSGFAIGGFTGQKENPNEVNYLHVTPDSTRINFDDLAKGNKSGFAIGGFTGQKTFGGHYFQLTPDSTRIYFDDLAKGNKSGFAIGGFTGQKTFGGHYFQLTSDSTSIAIVLAPKNNVVVSQEIVKNDGTLYIPNELATLSTRLASDITADSVYTGGHISNDGRAAITARGVCWSETPDPTIDDSFTNNGTGTGQFISKVTGLSAGTTYYVRAYAVNSVGVSYGQQVAFITPTLPEVTTLALSDITASTAKGSGNVIASGGATVTSRGVCWSTTENPTIADNKTVNGTGTGQFTSSITGLLPGVNYYVRAYAINIVGVAYGEQVELTTLLLPTVTTGEVADIFAASATGSGEVTSDGGNAITSRGLCWSITENPTISDNKTLLGEGTGEFTGTLTGLQGGTSYFVRSFATSVAGTAYGNQVTFTTYDTIPTVTTTSITNIGATTATSGGNVTHDGGATVTARGVVYSTSPNPTVETNEGITTDGTGAGEFSSSLTGLTASTTYYVRAYATNSEGTAYGQQETFTTSSGGGGSTVTDQNGNVYPTVIIGTQEWMAKNLRATTYRNGDPIPTGLSNSAWTSATSGAYAIYPHADIVGLNSDIEVLEAYGSLYNWYAVDDSRSLCPTGWHIPSDVELTTLFNYAGGESVAGGKLKSTRTDPNSHPRWSEPNTGATDEYGFSALPGGFRHSQNGTFNQIGDNCPLWSNTPSDTYSIYAWSWGMYYTFESTGINLSYKSTGFYVRCVKDSDPLPATLPTVTTTAASSITSTTATTGGNVTADGGATVTARGVVYSTSPNPTVETNEGITTDGTGTGEFTSSLTGLTANTTYYVRAYATNSVGTAYGSQESFTTSSGGGGSTVTDQNGNVYPTVIIGTQEWMAENLRTTLYRNGDPITTELNSTDWGNTTSGAYAIYPHASISELNSDEEVLNAYGALYNWYAVNDSRELCPTGWHVPSKDEWIVLINFVGGESVAGGKLKSTSTSPDPHPRWLSPNTGASDQYGLSLLGGGVRRPNGETARISDAGGYTSSSMYDDLLMWRLNAQYEWNSVEITYADKHYGYSVRCVRD